MNIGLLNLEPHIVNSAMMRVSQHHKQRGDRVEPYSALWRYNKGGYYDKIYAFSLFDFTPKTDDKGHPLVPPEAIRGGSGFNLTTILPPEIEQCNYDWSLYPGCDFSIIWFSQGCIRNCPFCIVQQKEGHIRPVTPKNLNPNGKHIKIMDNNFFANPQWREAFEQLLAWGQPVDMQGVDLRIMTEDHANALNELRHDKQIHIAWDNPRERLEKKLEWVIEHIPKSKLMCYVLIGYWSTHEENLYRVKFLQGLGIDPYVMPYDKHDRYQMDFTRWANHKAVFKSVDWADYDCPSNRRTKPEAGQ